MKLASFLDIPLFTISLGKLEFRPGLIPTLLTIVLTYILISLGQWQLHRAVYKDNIQQMISERRHLPAIDLQQAPHAIKERMFLPVSTSGRFDSAHQLLLDNQVVDHKPGYDVYTPLLRDHGPAILVRRGWIPLGHTRQDIPDLTLETHNIRINGLLAKSPSHGLILSDNANQYQHWPALIQFVDLRQIEKTLGYPLYPMILVLDGKNTAALHYKPITLSMGSDKHRAYAFQWFGLATALVIIYLVVNTKRGNRHND